MKEHDKKRLQLNSRELINNLIVADVADFLYEHDVLTQENMEALLSEQPAQKAARQLIVSILPRKGQDAFRVFCDALRDASYDYLADKLESTTANADAMSSCGGSKSAGKSSLSTSRNLEDELEDLRQKVRKVSVDAESVKSEQMKVKSKVSELEYENFVLKKQLSFYEENEGRRKSSVAEVHKSRSTGSFSSASNFGTRNSKAGTGPHGKRSSFAGFPSSVYMDEDTNINDFQPLYDEIDDQFLDTLDSAFSDNDDGCDCSYFDDTDGPKLREPGSAALATPRAAGARTAVNMLSADECALSVQLTDDIIGYFFSGQKKRPAELHRKYAQYILVMRRAVDSMSNKHGPLIEQISRQVDIALPWKQMLQQLQVILDDFMADEFNHGPLFWGRTVAIYTLAGVVARKCARRQKDVSALREYLTEYVNTRLVVKVHRVGGWDTFCEFIEAGGDNFPAIFPASMIQAAITAAASSHVHTHRTRASPTSSSGKNSPANLDLLKTI